MTDIVEYLRSQNAAEMRTILDRLNEEIRRSLREQRSFSLSGPTLARYLLYYALALGEAEGDDDGPAFPEHSAVGLAPAEATEPVDQAKKGRRTSPRFQKVLQAYLSFHQAVAAAPTEGVLASGISADDLEGFCHFSTRKRGSNKARFYISLALFVVHLSQSSELERPLIEVAIPPGERGFPETISNLVTSRVSVSATVGSASAEDRYGSVDVRFWYNRGKLRTLEGFVRYYGMPQDGCAHFVIYRVRRNNPLEVMKSFIAFKPPWAFRPAPNGEASSSYNFTHIYQPPDGKVPRRIGNGKIVPLDGGLYCVGGQKDLPSHETVPFKTLKAIALDWLFISRRDPAFSGLAMSANYDGEHLLSRIFLRATPISRSDDISLGAIPIADLADDLNQDFGHEREIVQALGMDNRFLCSFPQSTVESYISRLIDKTNNNPNAKEGWNVSKGFVSNFKSRRELTRAMIQHNLEEHFGHDRFTEEASSKPLNFWTDLRFGPLADD